MRGLLANGKWRSASNTQILAHKFGLNCVGEIEWSIFAKLCAQATFCLGNKVWRNLPQICKQANSVYLKL